MRNFPIMALMNTKAKIYSLLDTGWTSLLIIITLGSAAWVLSQVIFFLLGDITFSLNVLTDRWKIATTAYCTLKVDGCQKVTFEKQLLTTSPSGPSWQSIGARMDVNVVARPGTGESVKARLLEYVESPTSRYITINITESGGGK